MCGNKMLEETVTTEIFLDRAHSIPQASHSLCCVQPVVQLPISAASSVPEMTASHSAWGSVVQPSLRPQYATSAVSAPLEQQEGS